MIGFIADAYENNQEDYEKEILPKKNEPTLEQTSPLHSLQVIYTMLKITINNYLLELLNFHFSSIYNYY